MTGPDRLKSLRADTANSAVMVSGDGPHFAYWQALQAAYESGALVPQAALSAEYARGLRRAERLLRDEYGMHDAASAILALIPPPPSPVAASRGADPDNKEPRRASGPIDPAQGFATTGAEARWIADIDAGVYDDTSCTCCDDTGITIQTERFCQCGIGRDLADPDNKEPTHE